MIFHTLHYAVLFCHLLEFVAAIMFVMQQQICVSKQI